MLKGMAECQILGGSGQEKRREASDPTDFYVFKWNYLFHAMA